MKAYIEVLIEIPCFRCLIWNPINESHLHCNPNTCEELTEWLLREAEEQKEPAKKLVMAAVRAKT